MKIVCLSVGKKHEAHFETAIRLYEQRLKPYVDFSFELIQTGTLETESEAILKRLKSDEVVVLLDETGDSLDNRQLAGVLAEEQNRSAKKLIVIIGGAYGVSDVVKQRSKHTISLSSLVFPHQLIRLILVEQLYRSYNLLGGGRYHHD